MLGRVTARGIGFVVLGLWLLASTTTCDRKRRQAEPEPKPRATEAPRPRLLYMPKEGETEAIDLAQRDHPAPGVGTHSGVPPATGSRCPSDMVLAAGAYCIDRYEVHLVDASQGRDLSPHYPPSKHHSVSLYERWHQEAAAPRGILGKTLSLPAPPAFQLDEDFEPRAASSPGVLPAGYLTMGLAEMACKNAGKRLCSREEWVTACRGERGAPFPYGPEYEPGACNVHREHHPAQLLHGNSSRNHLDPRLNLTHDGHGPLLRPTGGTERCVSSWGNDGIYDMVGNLDEWIADPEGTFLGGFYARATKLGCDASIELHAPGYMDYSLGTRCCHDLRP